MNGNSENIYQKLATVFFYSFLLLLMTASFNSPADSQDSSVRSGTQHELLSGVIAEHTDAVIQASVRLPEFRQFTTNDPACSDRGSSTIIELLSDYDRNTDLNIILARRTRLAIDRGPCLHNIFHAVSGGDDDDPVLG